ncbi:DNA polymerase [Bradyrhizobium nanningense]|uniref:group II intron reverse transcriptase/maturase n=1 Tax=Bradyrhizobium nanningense TaxID=1325118 RepID=UPI001008F495|nr:group II intron reverse transcriptase/maturase [Bradyrhizobium nanningense]RXH24771.1 DNA polymerase [Bradyrhizobium nanningense]
MSKAKPFCIARRDVWEAYKQVKANQGAAGIDGQSIEDFDRDLNKNLYRIWNRMSSGSYFPPPVRRVEIPKGGAGSTRPLGIPTVSDRIAQMVVKRYLEPILEPVFHMDSYGYRPGKSAHDALAVARRRCWSHDWVLDLDIKSFFDEIDWSLLMKAVRRHTDCKWVLLYLQRWLEAPASMPDGSLVKRTRGTPQGAVISPLLANLFLHYAFDVWMSREYPGVPFERYADDAIGHCRSEAEARDLCRALEARFAECGLRLHPEKTKIVYCKDANRSGAYPEQSFDFLGYSFRPRMANNRHGERFVSFSPAVSKKAGKRMRHTVRRWRLHRRSDLELVEIAKWVRPVLTGWVRYYGRFYPSKLQEELRTIDAYIVRWATRKYKRSRGHTLAVWEWLRSLKRRNPGLFAHWVAGSTVG